MTKERNNMDDEVYRISAKGFLAVTARCYGDIDRIWKALEEFVKKEAMREGWTDGVPCLVFDGGGACITVQKNPSDNPCMERGKCGMSEM